MTAKLADPPHLTLVPPEQDFGPLDYFDGSEPPRERESDDRPLLYLNAEYVQPTYDSVIGEMSAALGSHDRVFQRGGFLTLLRARQWGKGLDIVQMTAADVRSLVSTRARLMEWRYVAEKKKKLPCESFPPPRQHCIEIEKRVEHPGVKPITGVLHAPSIRPDGSLLQTPGYDVATGYYYEPTEAFPAVADQPTQADAMGALQRLCVPWRTFPFADESSRYVPLAAALSLLARPAIEGPVPAFCADATVSGSGKTLAFEVANYLATGEWAGTTTYHPEQTERQLAGVSLEGKASLLFDNIAMPFGDEAIEAALTSMVRASRRLGVTGQIYMPWRTVVMATGNKLRLSTDMHRRAILCRYETQVEDPTRVVHPIRDLRAWTVANRAQCVADMLTVLRYHFVARPDHPEPGFGGYDCWAQVVRGALLSAGAPDILQSRPEPEEDEHRLAAGELLELLEPLGRFTTAELLRRMQGVNLDEISDDSRIRDAVRQLQSKFEQERRLAVDAQGLGRILKRLHHVIVNGRRLTHGGKSDGHRKWWVSAQ